MIEYDCHCYVCGCRFMVCVADSHEFNATAILDSNLCPAHAEDLVNSTIARMEEQLANENA